MKVSTECGVGRWLKEGVTGLRNGRTILRMLLLTVAKVSRHGLSTVSYHETVTSGSQISYG